MSGDGHGGDSSSGRGGREPPSLSCPNCGSTTMLEQFMSRFI